MNIRKKDLDYGYKCETELKPLIENYFKTEFKKTTNYDTFDFISKDENIYIELKSRNNAKNKYPTTMIGYNKIKKANQLINKNKKVFHFFKFTDGLYFYNQKKEDKFEIKQGGRFDRGRPELNQYAYIPINILSEFIYK